MESGTFNHSKLGACMNLLQVSGSFSSSSGRASKQSKVASYRTLSHLFSSRKLVHTVGSGFDTTYLSAESMLVRK